MDAAVPTRLILRLGVLHQGVVVHNQEVVLVVLQLDSLAHEATEVTEGLNRDLGVCTLGDVVEWCALLGSNLKVNTNLR